MVNLRRWIIEAKRSGLASPRKLKTVIRTTMEQNSEKVVANMDKKEDEIKTDELIKELKGKLEDVSEYVNKLIEMRKEKTRADYSNTRDRENETPTHTAVDKSGAKDVCERAENAFLARRSDRAKYDLQKFNIGINALGVENFMTAATQFCKEEAAAGEIPIVSIGSGDGTVEKEMIAQYRERFGEEIRIQLVDPDPKFERIVDFKTADHLIRENPRIVGNCVALIIWPNGVFREDAKDDYDIEAVRKLQPKAVLVVYESVGLSGSKDFRDFLHEDSLDDSHPNEFGLLNKMLMSREFKKKSYGLDNYSVVELFCRKISIGLIGTTFPRMIKMIRTN